MSKRPAQKHLFHVLTLSLVILLAGGGIALLYQWHQGTSASYASSDNVVGPPSLPAATVDSIFRQMGSPMVGTGQAVEAASRARNIDDAFALAVWWTETNDGAAGVGLADRNPGSGRGSIGYPSAYDGYTIYPSYTAAVNYWFMMMKNVYINRGLTTVYAISHPYVGTSTSNLWAGKVINLMQRYRAEAPPPTPTPAPTIAPDIKRQATHLSQEQQQQGQGKSTYYPPVAQVAQNTSAASSAHGLNTNSRNILILFALLLALTLALWAWSINRRSVRRVQPAPVAPALSNPWEQMRAYNQQPASFFGSFSGQLRTTDNLAPDLRTTETLVAASPMLSNYSSSEALFPLGAFMAGQAQFQRQAPQPAPSSLHQQHFSFDAPRAIEQQSFPLDIPTAMEQQSFPLDIPTAMGQQSFPFDASTTDYPAVTFLPRPGLAGLSRPLHPTRLQATSDTTERQLQPVGSGSGGRGGLLSRYRETQAWNERES